MDNSLETFSNAFPWKRIFLFWLNTIEGCSWGSNSPSLRIEYVMAWFQTGDKPLPEQMPTKISHVIWHHKAKFDIFIDLISLKSKVVFISTSYIIWKHVWIWSLLLYIWWFYLKFIWIMHSYAVNFKMTRLGYVLGAWYTYSWIYFVSSDKYCICWFNLCFIEKINKD